MSSVLCCSALEATVLECYAIRCVCMVCLVDRGAGHKTTRVQAACTGVYLLCGCLCLCERVFSSGNYPPKPILLSILQYGVSLFEGIFAREQQTRIAWAMNFSLGLIGSLKLSWHSTTTVQLARHVTDRRSLGSRSVLGRPQPCHEIYQWWLFLIAAVPYALSRGNNTCRSYGTPPRSMF